MGDRRVPLSNVPNAANSPFRAVAAAASKRPRIYENDGEGIYREQPPAKKQAIELKVAEQRTPTRKHLQPTDRRIVHRADATYETVGIDRVSLTARDKTVVSKAAEQTKTADEPIDTLRQWQKHYRKVFPSFVFYFDGVSEIERGLCSRQLSAFGAREEKFFSKTVTHVVTTRPIPSDHGIASLGDGKKQSMPTNFQENSQSRTINPSLLQRTLEQSSNLQNQLLKSKFTFEPQSSKRSMQPDAQEFPLGKGFTGSNNVLAKAKEMGIKIWQLEKVNRILQVMSESGEGEGQSQHNHYTRSNTAVTAPSKRERQTDLSQLIKNEELNGHVDRELICAANDIITFSGPYIYIYDMNEKTKPVLVREYPKVQDRQDGLWPQFRSASQGKCPFLDEAGQTRRTEEREQQAKDDAKAAREKFQLEAVIPRSRPATSRELVKMNPPSNTSRKRPLATTETGGNTVPQQVQQLPAALSRDSCDENSEVDSKTNLRFPPRMRPGLYGGEPLASGIQASNITSAIRSQMISSTAAAPGAKAGTSKEIHELKRKVLERNSGPALTGLANVQTIDPAATLRSLRGIPGPRVAKQKAQEKLGSHKPTQLYEGQTRSEQEEADRKAALGQINHVKAMKGEPREPKPGYCENCREKFDDFEDHIIGRKHRKFATNKENWKELDDLLKDLIRPLRQENEHT